MWLPITATDGDVGGVDDDKQVEQRGDDDIGVAAFVGDGTHRRRQPIAFAMKCIQSQVATAARPTSGSPMEWKDPS
jgi:hypothetical protein